MKKIFNTMMAVAIAAFTFTACEDVPEPYNNPYDSKVEEPEVTVDPTGDGSEATPWNVVAALEACANLGAGEYVNNGDDVYVTGVITQIDELSTSYGNATYYISDNLKSGYQLEIYRGYSMGGEKFTSDSEIEVGDSVTVCGKIVFYNGSVLEFTTGSKLVYLKKGEGGGNTDKPEVSTVGSKDAPKTVTEALAAINAMNDGATSTEYWFVKGKVVRVTTSQANFDQYKNLNYLISEDGTETNTITVYSGNGLDNAQFSGIDALKAGDEVVVYGQLQKYINNNTGAMTPEIAKGNYLVKYTPAGGNSGNEEPGDETTGNGSEANPWNVAAALQACASLGADEYVNNGEDVYVVGIITQIDEISTSYGNATYYISDDTKGSNSLMVYRGYSLNGDRFASETEIEVGDLVTVCGKIVNFKGNTLEFTTGSKLVNLTKGEGGNQGGNDDNDNAGNTTTITMADFGLENAADLTTLSANGVTLTFSQEGGNNAPKYYTSGNAARMYALNTLTITGSKAMTKVVLTCAMNGTNPANGNDMMYGEANNTKVTTNKDSDTQVTFSNFSSNTLKIVNDHTQATSGTQLRIVSIKITYAN